MSNLFWLTEAQMARIEPYFPKVRKTRNRSSGSIS